MTNILVVNSSPNPDNSVSRDMTRQFVEDWRLREPDVSVIYRDVGLKPPPHLDQATIGAYYTPHDALTDEQAFALALSNQIVEEAENADVIVIGSPMHNFGITSGLKTWIDHLARVGRTFNYTENGPVGALGGRKVFILTARGGQYTGGAPAAAMDMQAPYLKTVLGFLGLADVTFVHAEGIAGGTEGKETALLDLSKAIESLHVRAA